MFATSYVRNQLCSQPAMSTTSYVRNQPCSRPAMFATSYVRNQLRSQPAAMFATSYVRNQICSQPAVLATATSYVRNNIFSAAVYHCATSRPRRRRRDKKCCSRSSVSPYSRSGCGPLSSKTLFAVGAGIKKRKPGRAHIREMLDLSYIIAACSQSTSVPLYFTRVLGPGDRFPQDFTRILGLGGRFPSYFMRVLAPGGRFPSYFTRFLGPGRHQESLQKASAADLEENVSNRAFL